MFCENCGKEIPDNMQFCPECGTPAKVQKKEILLGFSNKINDPAFDAAQKKNAKATFIFGIILVLMPLVITFFISLAQDNMKILAAGAFISVVFLVFWLVSYIKEQSRTQWDGTVVNKKTEHRKIKGQDGYENLCIVEIKTDKGKTKKLEEKEGFTKYYYYLQVGDRIRFHPQFNYYYEKYDKTHDETTYCPICGQMVSLSRDKCSCGVPVLK